MKIYFVASISGRQKYLDNYKLIIDTLKKQGHTVYEDTIRPSQEEVYGLNDDEKVKFYKQVLTWINKSDVVIAETSHSSLSVGHEISVSLDKSKPVVVLYTEGHAPHFLEAIRDDRLIIEKYDEKNVSVILEDALEKAANQQDTRFNFFITPRIAGYLDWLSKTKRMPRAVYLRKLIEDHMNENQDYQKTA